MFKKIKNKNMLFTNEKLFKFIEKIKKINIDNLRIELLLLFN